MTRTLIVIYCIDGDDSKERKYYGNGVNSIGECFSQEVVPFLGKKVSELEAYLETNRLSLDSQEWDIFSLLTWIDTLVAVMIEKDGAILSIELLRIHDESITKRRYDADTDLPLSTV